MSLFSGYNPITLDSQKRLAVPARYRDAVAETSNNQLVATRGHHETNKYLQLYPMDKWQAVLSQIAALPSMHPVAQGLRRKIVGFASELTVDKNGRLLIPQALREYAGVDKQVVLSGVGETFELWDEAAWNRCMEEQDLMHDFDSLPEAFQQLQLS